MGSVFVVGSVPLQAVMSVTGLAHDFLDLLSDALAELADVEAAGADQALKAAWSVIAINPFDGLLYFVGQQLEFNQRLNDVLIADHGKVDRVQASAYRLNGFGDRVCNLNVAAGCSLQENSYGLFQCSLGAKNHSSNAIKQLVFSLHRFGYPRLLCLFALFVRKLNGKKDGANRANGLNPSGQSLGLIWPQYHERPVQGGEADYAGC